MGLTYTKFNTFIEKLFEKKLDFGSDTFKLMLSNTAPTAASDSVKTDITEISAGNGYTAGGEALTITSSSQTGGTYTWVITSNITWTADTGSIGPFRYFVLWDDTATNDDLVSYWDYGSSVTLNDGDDFTANVSGTVITAS